MPVTFSATLRTSGCADEVGDVGRGPAPSAPITPRLAEDPVDERDAVAPRALRLFARHQARKVESSLAPSSAVYGHLM